MRAILEQIPQLVQGQAEVGGYLPKLPVCQFVSVVVSKCNGGAPDLELGMRAALAQLDEVFSRALLTLAASPRLAWSGAVLLTMAMAGLAAVHGVDMAAYGLTRSGNLAAAKSVLDGDHLGPPGVVLVVMFLGGAALGTLALATAIWRSPLVPRVATVFVLGFAVLDFALGQGVVSHIVNLVGLSLVAVAVVVGYSRKPGSVSWVSRSAWW